MKKTNFNRKFNWVSSSDPRNKELLNDLNDSMIKFYSKPKSRDSYQQMVDRNDNNVEDPGIVTEKFINYLKTLRIETILEVGCGTGRIFKFLKKALGEIKYTGIEVSEKIINLNKENFPSASWKVAGAYDLPVDSESVDVCFSFYVLEHLVFPEKAICEMLRVVKKGGYLILIFPDFAASGRFASQRIGLSDRGTAGRKIEKGKLFDAVVSLYDSRIRLPRALKNSINNIGAFPVNSSPKCLSLDPSLMEPDVDAVYIASKNEINNWAINKGYEVFFPAGTTKYFNEHAFISIKKNSF